MKKTLLFIALALGVSNFTFAQAANHATATNKEAVKPSIEQRIDKRVARMTQELNLTPQQQASVKQILTQNANTSHDAKQANNQAQAHDIRKGTRAQVEAILTPEQKLKLNKLEAEHKTHTANTKS